VHLPLLAANDPQLFIEKPQNPSTSPFKLEVACGYAAQLRLGREYSPSFGETLIL
jgi:hypothetical protein